MPIAKSTGTFNPLPGGTHVARCFGVISLGTQPSNNPAFPERFKIMLMWEVPNEPVEVEGETRPMTIHKEYTCSLSEKSNLRHDLESWRGRAFTPQELEGFDVANVVGQVCQLSVVHQQKRGGGGVYAKINGVFKLQKGARCSPQFHKSTVYEIEHKQAGEWDKLPEWIQKKIAQCAEWQAAPAPAAAPEQAAKAAADADDGPMDDVPF